MRRGGFGKEASDQPHKDVPVTPVVKVLHPVTRIVMALAFVAGGNSALFLWDARYAIAAVFVMVGCLIVGPWVWPHERVRLEQAPRTLELGDDEVHL